MALPHIDIDLAEDDYLELVLDHTLLTGSLYSAMLNVRGGA